MTGLASSVLGCRSGSARCATSTATIFAGHGRPSADRSLQTSTSVTGTRSPCRPHASDRQRLAPVELGLQVEAVRADRRVDVRPRRRAASSGTATAEVEDRRILARGAEVEQPAAAARARRRASCAIIGKLCRRKQKKHTLRSPYQPSVVADRAHVDRVGHLVERAVDAVEAGRGRGGRRVPTRSSASGWRPAGSSLDREHPQVVEVLVPGQQLEHRDGRARPSR